MFKYARAVKKNPTVLQFSSKFPNIFQVFFSVKETLALSFDDVVFSKGGCLDVKNVITIVEKICIFLNGLTYDTRQKFQISFEPKGLLPSLTPLMHNFK